MSTYHFIAASEAFLTVEEPLEEVLRERVRHYGEQGKAIDFWLVTRPAFLEAPELASLAARVPRPAAAVVAMRSSVSPHLPQHPRYHQPHSSRRVPILALWLANWTNCQKTLSQSCCQQSLRLTASPSFMPCITTTPTLTFTAVLGKSLAKPQPLWLKSITNAISPL